MKDHPLFPYFLEKNLVLASVSTLSANEPAKDLIVVHTVELKLMIKVQISGRMIYSGISDVAFI